MLFITGLVFFGAGCSGGSSSNAKGESRARPTTTAPIPTPTVTATVANGATNVPIASTVGLQVANGTIAKVSFRQTTDSKTQPRSGVFNAQRNGWLGPNDLAPNTPYALTASITDQAGRMTTKTWSFTTGGPKAELHTTVNVADGGTYGVGMPIIVTLSSPVPQMLHKTVTDRLNVTSTPSVEGGWHWFSDTELHYRPKEYWPAHTQVTFNIDFAKLNVGNGVWGVDGRAMKFAIGDSHISTVDAAKHTMSVAVNGQEVRNLPVSTGSDRHPTHNGIHVVNEKASRVIMDSSTVGIPRSSPDGYYLDVKWAVRISNSGEYVHAAPWSVGSQGNSNVSHGCVNVSTANAEWFYNMSMSGDVVNVINTNNPLQPLNGYGDWVVPWDQWVN